MTNHLMKGWCHMKRPYITVKKFMMWEYLVTGVMFLTLGIIDNIMHIKAAALIASLLLFTITIMALVCKTEKFDEMANVNMHKAYHVGYVAFMAVIVILVLIELVGGIDVTMFTVLNFCFGVGNTTIGIAFRYFENEGDDLC